MTVSAITLSPHQASLMPKNGSLPDAETKNRVVTSRAGRQDVAIRVFFEVEGGGSFRASNFDTAAGLDHSWMKPKSVIRLEARARPGHRFSHWIVNGEYAGRNRSRRVVAARGMVIRAVFVPLGIDDIRC